MIILVYNKKTENMEIQTVRKAVVISKSCDGIEKYGVMIDVWDEDKWFFVPADSKEAANECLRNLFVKKQLDLTNISMFDEYGRIEPKREGK